MIRNIMVDYEEVLAPQAEELSMEEDEYEDDDDFEIVSIDAPAKEEEVMDMFEKEEEQFTLSFDLPLNDDLAEVQQDEDEVVYDLADDDLKT